MEELRKIAKDTLKKLSKKKMHQIVKNKSRKFLRGFFVVKKNYWKKLLMLVMIMQLGNII